MKPAPFRYVRVSSMDEAIEALQRHPDAKVLAGGQSLIPLMNFRLSRPSVLVDINDVAGEWGHITLRDQGLEMGALVRHQQLATHPLVLTHLPILAEAASHIGHWAIRNRGTLGGSLAHADPASELPAAMVALDARLVVRGPAGIREIPAREFFLGLYLTALAPDEVIQSVWVPFADGQQGFAEVARRVGDFALAGAYVTVQPKTVEVTWFGIADTPVRVDRIARDRIGSDSTVWRAILAEAVSDIPSDPVKWHEAEAVAHRAYQQATGRRELGS